MHHATVRSSSPLQRILTVVLALLGVLVLDAVSPQPGFALATGSITAHLEGAAEDDGVVVLESNAGDWESVAQGPVDGSGNFTATGLQPGEYLVVFAPENQNDPDWYPWLPWGHGYAQLRTTVSSGATTPVSYTKGITGSMAGRITGPDGAGAAGVEICLWRGGEHWGPATAVSGPPCGGGAESAATTDGAGDYQIDELVPQDWIVFVGDPSGTLSVGYRLPGKVPVTPSAVTPGVDVELAAGFSDVPSTNPFIEAISWMAVEGISTGYPIGTFAPAASVSRQAMASFLYRYAGEPAVGLTEPHFADVPVDHPFFDAIQWMAASGLSTGTPDPAGGKPLYKPSLTVSRQAMAAFLWRQAGMPTVSTSWRYFGDVPPDHAFFTPIQWMGATGLSTGTPNPPGLPRYKPIDPVSRQAMAAFLYRNELQAT